MTAGSLSTIARKHVTAVPRALKALAALERELSQAATCDEIRKVVDQAEAFKLLFGDIDVVEAEDVILAAGARIGEEIAKVPKANARRRITTQGKWSAGRKEALASGTQRARFQKLAAAKPDLKAIAKKLREQGKEATPTAIVRELTQGDKKESRQRREIELGARQRVLPTTKHGAILGIPNGVGSLGRVRRAWTAPPTIIIRPANSKRSRRSSFIDCGRQLAQGARPSKQSKLALEDAGLLTWVWAAAPASFGPATATSSTIRKARKSKCFPSRSENRSGTTIQEFFPSQDRDVAVIAATKIKRRKRGSGDASCMLLRRVLSAPMLRDLSAGAKPHSVVLTRML